MKRRILYIVLSVVLISTLFTACSSKENETAAANDPAATNAAASDIDLSYVDGSGNIVIPTESISDTAIYADYVADGTVMEILAVRDSSGEIRLAYNTCQVCMGSPKAYYVQQGDSFICQNCGNVFSTEDIGVEHGGCNPVPVEADINDTSVIISKSTLQSATGYFTNWKGLNP